MTIYLIASNVYGAVQGPISRGFSYIEVWMVGIQITILLAILEYAIVLALCRLSKDKEALQVGSLVKTVRGKNELEVKKAPATYERLIQLIDKCTMFGSFLFFLFFNIFYWMNT